ncbi:efflux RND transporter periplasmic adaptor subunit [Gloeocapsopsis dulcis]|uniref:Efflux transporter periplasmic adaptor subunit n=2 Tax=Gloeocapsopsis TaxID=693222 RepID=A0A6N8FYN3_9CHRO|nr:efflux RND transporter periplasmic adaptor subunit [Gloeocapsopsis dulcis]MUL37026.1 efflux transporter periplasmic adaptor subunit [Gloeocapsopsis dulcis AAB1 = 1H9]WNN87879.1 efflux RND transporter periplasmic adaptor subunit [Gloeocapsopsis dulcis]
MQVIKLQLEPLRTWVNDVLPSYIKPATIVCSGVVFSLIFLATPSRVLPHGGHDHGFGEGSGANQAPGTVEVDTETAKRIGIKVEPVTRQRLAIGIKTTGQIETLPNQKAEVTAPLNSTVVELLVNPGDAVRKGQAVAVISSPELVQLRVESQEKQAEGIADLQQAQADLNLAQQNYQQYSQIAAAEIAQARSQVNFAQEKYNRDRELAAAGALPRRNALESQTQAAQAQAELTKAASRRDVLAAEAQLKRAQSAVKVAQSRINLSNATYQTRLQQLGTQANARGLVTVTAPISGTIADREVTLGQSFQDAGGKLMTIVNASRVFATANIYEKDLAQVQTNQRVNAKVAALPNRTFSGRITRIGSAVEGETRVVPVQAELDNLEGQLKPGMFAELEVLTDRTATSRLAIPSSAVVEANGQSIVYVQNGNAYLPVEVTLGETFSDMVEIESDLFEGDLIVTQRSPQLYAQSLRAGNTTTADTPEESPSQPQSQIPSLPWWLVGVGGGAVIGTGAFMAGVWSSRRHQRRLAASNNSLATFNKHHEPKTQINQLESSLKHPSDF